MAKAVLTVNNLQVAFAARPIVRNVSFQLRPGEVLGIIGESGSGKSATCLSILGLLQGAKVQGSTQLLGQELIGLNAAALRQIRGQKIGMILQNPASFLIRSPRSNANSSKLCYPIDRSQTPLPNRSRLNS
ncbi:MAG: ATP-binding cassette domain-containing protein [Leptolyngbyaceae cyanobacterium SM1_3_5]|nr:ATP-binding cassette domain-containing protein [Leptolyngbyaceae cyanobacterium SM1_3_5]